MATKRRFDVVNKFFVAGVENLVPAHSGHSLQFSHAHAAPQSSFLLHRGRQNSDSNLVVFAAGVPVKPADKGVDW